MVTLCGSSSLTACMVAQASVNSRIAELEAARLSCEADEDAALRLQGRLARLQTTVAQTRCVVWITILVGIV